MAGAMVGFEATQCYVADAGPQALMNFFGQVAEHDAALIEQLLVRNPVALFGR